MFGRYEKGFAWIPAISVGLSALGLGLQVKGALDAEDAGDEAARAEQAATDESVRRLEKEKVDVLGRQKVGAARAGIDVGSKSVLELAAEAADEFDAQIALERDIGASRARSAGLEADVASATAFSQALTTAGSTLAYIEQVDWNA